MCKYPLVSICNLYNHCFLSITRLDAKLLHFLVIHSQKFFSTRASTFSYISLTYTTNGFYPSLHALKIPFQRLHKKQDEHEASARGKKPLHSVSVCSVFRIYPKTRSRNSKCTLRLVHQLTEQVLYFSKVHTFAEQRTIKRCRKALFGETSIGLMQHTEIDRHILYMTLKLVSSICLFMYLLIYLFQELTNNAGPSRVMHWVHQHKAYKTQHLRTKMNKRWQKINVQMYRNHE